MSAAHGHAAHGCTVLLLPGWMNSGAGHWQTLWEQHHGDLRVPQHDWEAPLRGDWICQLEATVADTPGPLLLAAHSLGCHLAAAWAELSPAAARVRGALLVAPPDLSRADLPPALHSWAGHALHKLPFAAHVVSSTDDPYCEPAAAARLAEAWGARHTVAGALGHINADSGLGEWPQGRAWLAELGRPAAAPRLD